MTAPLRHPRASGNPASFSGTFAGEKLDSIEQVRSAPHSAVMPGGHDGPIQLRGDDEKWTSRTLPFAALAALAFTGCSEPVRPPPEPTVTVRLSSDDPDANAPAVAAFFRRTCLDASGDPGAFELAVQGSGWDIEKIRTADAANPVTSWRIGDGRVYYSRVEVGPRVRVIDCHVELDGQVAPSVERMRAALRPLIAASAREARDERQDAGWRWRSSPNEERALTVSVPAAGARSRPSAARRPGVAIHFATTPVEAEPIPAGTGNVQ